MKRLVCVLCAALIGAALASCGGGGAGSGPASTSKATYSVSSQRLRPCGGGGGSANVWVLGLSCGDVPSELESNVRFAETDVLGTQPVRIIQRRLNAEALQTSDGWTCTGQLTGRTINTLSNTCWRDSKIIRFGPVTR